MRGLLISLGLAFLICVFALNSYADEVTTEFEGGTYSGEVSNGIPHGQGTWTHPDGAKYVGKFKDGNLHGQGTLILGSGKYSGDIYVGEFKDGKKYGQGTYTWPNGAKYVGEWKDGKIHGQGTYTYADGAMYVGEFKYGKWHGQGTYTFADGAMYVGEFKDGKRDGQGTYTYADGSKYVGEFRKDKRHGQGTYTNADGLKYVGEYKDDKEHGQGTVTTPDGRKHVGKFKDGKPWKGIDDSLFRSVDDQFRLLYPETWIVKKGQGANVKAKVVADDGSSCNVVVRPLPSDIAQIPNNQAMDELSAVDLLDMLQVKWPDAVLLEGGKTHIDNRVALYGYSDLTHNAFNVNVKVRQLSVFTMEYGKVYFITCMARVELFSKHKSTFEKIVRSFVFEY